MNESLFHGTSFHRVCQIFDLKQLKGKEREGEGKQSYVSFTEDILVGFWFGDIVLEFPGLKANAIKIEYENEEWKNQHPELCEYILEGVELEELNSSGIEGLANEKEYVIPETYSFDPKDIIIHMGNEDENMNKKYEERLRKVFGEDLTISSDQLLDKKLQSVALDVAS